MLQTIKRNKFVIIIAIMCVITLFAGILATTSVLTVRADDKEEEKPTFSLYDVSTILGEYADNATKPNEENGGKPSGIKALDDGAFGSGGSDGNYGSLQTGDTGAFVAYAEKGWLSSIMSNSSTTYSYQAFNNMVVNAAGDKTTKIFLYCQYGYLLSELGLDTTASESAFAIGPMLTGALMLSVYILSLAVPLLFQLILKVLKTLNPFRLFAAAVNATGLLNMSSKMGGEWGEGNIMSGLAGTVGKWYTAFYSLSWAIIVPIFFLSLIVSYFLLRQSDKMRSKIKKYIIRIVFIVMGIPILGACYTSTLNSMSKVVGVENGSATKLVASTFLDFEAWAEKGRLSIVPGAILEVKTRDYDRFVSGLRSPTSSAYMNTRATAYYINQEYSYDMLTDAPPFTTAANAKEVANWNKEIYEDEDDSFEGQGDGSTVSNVSQTLSILGRYMTADYYYGSDYETVVKSALTNAATKPKYSFYIYNMFNNAAKLNQFYATASDKSDEQKQREIARYRFRRMTDFYHGNVEDTEWEDNSSYPMPNIFANGGIGYNVNDNVSKYVEKGSSGVISGKSSFFDNLTQESGLSSMSMFNYLNTSFGSNTLTVYSSERASSGFVRKGHRSISLVGSGFTSVLYYLNCLILLIAFTIIGFFYAFAIMFANMKRSIHLIISVPMALLGSIRAIAKVVTYTVMLILEVFATIFLYTLITELLMNISGMIEAPFAALVDGKNWIGNVLGSFAMPLLLIFSIIVYIIFTVVAIKMRKSVVKTFDQASAEVIDKFFDTKNDATSNSKQPGMLASAAGGLAAGAGMGLGNRMMNGMGASGSKNPSSGGGRSTSPTAPNGTASAGSGSASGADGADGDASEIDGGDTPATDVNVDTDAEGNEVNAEGADANVEGADVNAENADGNEDAAFDGDSEAHQDEQSDKEIAKGLEGQDSLAGASPQGESEVDNKMEAKADETEAETQAGLDEATGKTTAMEAEDNQDKKDALEKEAKKEGREQAKEGGKQAAVGAAKTAVGAYTDNPQMVAEGAQETKQGLDNAKDGQEKSKNAKAETSKQVNDEQNAKNKSRSVTDDRPNSSQRPSDGQKPTRTQNNGNNTQQRQSSGQPRKTLSSNSGQRNGSGNTVNNSSGGNSTSVSNNTANSNVRQTANTNQTANRKSSRQNSSNNNIVNNGSPNVKMQSTQSSPNGKTTKTLDTSNMDTSDMIT